MRTDFFLVWGHGLDHVDEIREMIKEEFHVMMEDNITYEDSGEFIDQIYKCDKVPASHLREKNSYLFKVPKKARIFIVENTNPRERIVGDGEFRHLQCQRINDMKVRIRNKFNPRNPNEHRGPLNKGVSHNHVVHASDYPAQVEHVLNYLNIPYELFE